MPELARLAEIHAASFTSAPRPWTADEIGGMLASPHCFLLRQGEGFLIGQALAGEAELLTLAVSPEARRQGLGRRLVADFLEGAARRGAFSAFLEVSAENQAAIALYEAAGFVAAGRRKAYYQAPDGGRTDAIVMQISFSGARG